MSETLSCGVLGAGSFGTALASVLLENGHDVTLWCFEDGHADEVNEAGRNTRYQTDFLLPGIRATASLEEAASDKDLVLFVSPSHVTRNLARTVAPLLARCGKQAPDERATPAELCRLLESAEFVTAAARVPPGYHPEEVRHGHMTKEGLKEIKEPNYVRNKLAQSSAKSAAASLARQRGRWRAGAHAPL